MPEKNKSKPIPQGILHEYRVARLRFFQGYFVRRSIDLWTPNLAGDKLGEIDVVSVHFDPQLRRTVEIAECKTTSGGSKEIDRIVWVKGLGVVAKARHVVFSKQRVDERSWDFARKTQVDVLDEGAIRDAEVDLGIQPESWVGFHDPEFGETTVKAARSAVGSSAELQKAGKYLYGSFWFAEDFHRLRLLRRMFRLLAENKSKIPAQTYTIGWTEAFTLLILTTLSIASLRGQRSESSFRGLVEKELETRFGDAKEVRHLLREIDAFRRNEIESIHKIYEASNVAREIFPMLELESQILTPQDWLAPFTELATRLGKKAHLANNLLRYSDLWASEQLGSCSGLKKYSNLFGSSLEELASIHALVGVFIDRYWGAEKPPQPDRESIAFTEDPPEGGRMNRDEHSLNVNRSLIHVATEPVFSSISDTTETPVVQLEESERLGIQGSADHGPGGISGKIATP